MLERKKTSDPAMFKYTMYYDRFKFKIIDYSLKNSGDYLWAAVTSLKTFLCYWELFYAIYFNEKI